MYTCTTNNNACTCTITIIQGSHTLHVHVHVTNKRTSPLPDTGVTLTTVAIVSCT